MAVLTRERGRKGSHRISFCRKERVTATRQLFLKRKPSLSYKKDQTTEAPQKNIDGRSTREGTLKIKKKQGVKNDLISTPSLMEGRTCLGSGTSHRGDREEKGRSNCPKKKGLVCVLRV